MRFIQAGEYAINLDLVTTCRLHPSGKSLSINFTGQEGSIVLEGGDAQKVWSALSKTEGKPN
jgi:hypothetical protein